MSSNIDPQDLHWFTGAKLMIAACIIKFTPYYSLGILLLIIATFTYRRVIALICGVHAMDVNDLICF